MINARKLRNGLVGAVLLAQGASCTVEEGDNIYQLPGGSGEGNGGEVTCETMASKTMQCGYHKESTDYEDIVYECKSLGILEEGHSPKYGDCIVNSPCSEIVSGSCDQFIKYK